MPAAASAGNAIAFSTADSFNPTNGTYLRFGHLQLQLNGIVFEFRQTVADLNAVAELDEYLLKQTGLATCDFASTPRFEHTLRARRRTFHFDALLLAICDFAK